jgi:hypothetical protein
MTERIRKDEGEDRGREREERDKERICLQGQPSTVLSVYTCD